VSAAPETPPVPDVRVDVHAHLMPGPLFDDLPEGLAARHDEEAGEIALVVAARDDAVGRGAPEDLREIGLQRARQRERGVDVTLVGPWIDMVLAPLDERTQTALCRSINRSLAAAVDGRATRFLAALPDLDGGAAADVLAEALEAGAVGGMLAANPGEGTLARADLDALWRAAESLEAPLVLHPGAFHPPPRQREFFMVNLVGNPYETTLAVGCLLGAEVPDRFPDLKVVLVHGGGFFPYQFGRINEGFRRWPGLRGRAGKPPAEHLRWFHYDTVLFDDAPTRYLLDLVRDDRVLAGSDCPFTMCDHRPFQLPDSLGLDDAGRRRVLGANAVDLFGLATTAPSGAQEETHGSQVHQH
jgi:aminocarboxymuconate-semialdehyde decarboxylase